MFIYILIIFLIASLSVYIFNREIKQTKEKFSQKSPFAGWTDDQYEALFYNYKNCSSQKFKGVTDINFKKINPKDFSPIPVKYRIKFDWADGISYSTRTENKNADNFYYNYLGKSIVSPVKNQGNCGCCYAFATIGVIESAYYLSIGGFGNLKEFSVQQIIDCTSSDVKISCNSSKPSHGCGGGDLLDIVGAYFKTPRKILFDTDYSYTSYYNTAGVPPGEDGNIKLTNYDFVVGDDNCDTKTNNYYLDTGEFVINDYRILSPIDAIIIDKEEYLKQAIYNYGPVSVSYLGGNFKENINGTNYFPFKEYPFNEFGKFEEGKYISEAGVYNGPISFSYSLSHAMIITGWGKDETYGTNQNYWLVKNTWGELWGLQGFVRFPMGENVFNQYYAIEFRRSLCDSCNTIISLTENPLYLSEDKLFVAKIIFKAYRISVDNKIKISIKITKKTSTPPSFIAPIKPRDPVYGKYEPLANKSGVNLQDNNIYYYNKTIDNNFIQSSVNEGLWFKGQYNIIGTGDVVPPIEIDSYKWDLIIQVIDKNNSILSQDQTEINWKNVFIV
jgi:hypothetical protein